MSRLPAIKHSCDWISTVPPVYVTKSALSFGLVFIRWLTHSASHGFILLFMFFALKKGCWIFFVRHLFTHSSWKSFSQFFTTHSGYLSCKAFSLTTAVHLLSVALSWPTDQNQIQLLNQLWLGVKGFQCSSGLLCLCSQSKMWLFICTW